jgi:protein TonB
VAYQTDLGAKDKGGAIAAVIAIHAGLLFALLHLSGTIDLTDPQATLRVFDVSAVKPPPPPQQHQPKPKPMEKEGGSAPKNIKSEANPVVAPKPRIETAPIQPIAATETPRQGTAPTQGASNVHGPGTGAGGTGTGTGSGSGGTGPGGGGDGGIAARAQLLTPSLRSRDYPRELRERLAQGRAPFVIFTVLPNGRVSNCRTFQSSGDPALDTITCALVTNRFVYRPAYNRRGEPVSSQMAYRQAE